MQAHLDVMPEDSRGRARPSIGPDLVGVVAILSAALAGFAMAASL